MAVHRRHVKVTSPCPIELPADRGSRGEKGWYCGHCRKNVHVLSNLTEREARALLAANVGRDMCVTYAVRADGSIRFRPEPEAPLVPPGALIRRRAAAAAAAAAAVGLSAALAACTPHDNPEVGGPSIVVEDPPSRLDATPTIPEVQARTVVEPDALMVDEIMVDGGLRAEPVPPPKPGGLKVAPLPEPEPVAVPGGLTVAPLPPGGPDEPCDGRTPG